MLPRFLPAVLSTATVVTRRAVVVRISVMTMVPKGAVYTTLDRLVGKGYLDSRLADADETRAGRPRRYFSLTNDGLRALREAREAFESLWTGLEGAVEDGTR